MIFMFLFLGVLSCGLHSDGCSEVYYKDFDADRFSDGVTSCDRLEGFYPAEELLGTFGDCDDGNREVYPGVSTCVM